VKENVVFLKKMQNVLLGLQSISKMVVARKKDLTINKINEFLLYAKAL
jgi:hypothetical protein